MERLKIVRRVLINTLILNSVVALAKIVYGYMIGSISMLSDGFHSFFDSLSNVIGIIGVWIASHPPDSTHPYGHRKFENLFTIVIAMMIFATGIEILRNVYSRIKDPVDIDVTPLSFLIMIITLTINFGVMIYETKRGRELHSDFLIADAMHTKSDIFVSISVIISLGAARAGYPVVDVIAALLITILIIKMGIEILKSAAMVLTDAACIEVEKIKNVVMGIKGVMACHSIRTRGGANHVNVDLHVLVDEGIVTKEAHEIAHNVEDAIKEAFPSVKDVLIHIEPYRVKKG